MKKIMLVATSVVGISLMFNEVMAINRQIFSLPSKKEEKLFAPLLLADISINRITNYPSSVESGTINPSSPNTNPLPQDTPEVLEEIDTPGTITSNSNSSLVGSTDQNLSLLTPAIIAVGNELGNSLTGNELSNILEGLDGDDSLDGGAGIDTLKGGKGNDRYYVDNIADLVIEDKDEGFDSVNSTVNYTLGDNLENLSLLGAAIQAIGNDLDNTLLGNDSNNELIGGKGNDVLLGGLGADIMIGGEGDDTYSVDTSGDTLIENNDEGTDAVISSIDFDLTNHVNIENLFLSDEGTGQNGKGNDLDNNIIGNKLDNTLEGGKGNDELNGKEGNDTLIGGEGDDLYHIDNINDTVTELADEGNDTVSVSFDDYTLDLDNIENLTLEGSAITGTGNDEANKLTGNNENNVLNGGQGDDILEGGAGDDSLTGGEGKDIFSFTKKSGGFHDPTVIITTPDGEEIPQALYTDDDGKMIPVDASLKSTLDIDTITDFSVIDDKIRFDKDVYNEFGGSLSAANFRSGAGVTSSASANDYLIYNTTDGKLYYDQDGSGTEKASVQIGQLTAGLSLTIANFELD